jgi:hypothetical protein
VVNDDLPSEKLQATNLKKLWKAMLQQQNSKNNPRIWTKNLYLESQQPKRSLHQQPKFRSKYK